MPMELRKLCFSIYVWKILKLFIHVTMFAFLEAIYVLWDVSLYSLDGGLVRVKAYSRDTYGEP